MAGVEAGIATTSSDTNTQTRHQKSDTAQKPFLESFETWLSTIKRSFSTGGAWRYASHVLLLALVLCVAMAGKIQADSIKTVKTASLGAQQADQSTMLASGAILAETAQLVIAPDIKAAANTAANQMLLATTAEGFLTKKAPITTAESTKRGMTNYTVLSGDTVSSIAAKYNVATDTVLWANNFDESTALKPGQQLIILPINGLFITAAGGESLDQIAQTYQASANLIDSYNQLEGKPLAAGQKLIIPDGVKPTPVAPVARLAAVKTTFPTRTLGSYSGGANSYSYGYCTYYVASRRSIPSNWGNASSWYYNAIATGYGVSSTPQAGAVAWESGNHVAYVERVNGDGTVTVSEMNFWANGGGWNRVSSRTTSASHFKYIY